MRLSVRGILLLLKMCCVVCMYVCVYVCFNYCMEQNIIHQARTVFGRHKTGYVFPMLLCVKPMESSTEFVGMVKQLNGEDEFIMFSTLTGVICAVTKESMSLLGVRAPVIQR